MATEYINVSNADLKKLFHEFTEYDRKVYFTLCNHATFKHRVFGVYKHQTFATLNSLIENFAGEKRQILQLQRCIKKLEKGGLVKVIEKKNELIIALDPEMTIETLKAKIENHITDFNIWADRIGQLEANLDIKFDIKFDKVKKIQSNTSAQEQTEEIPF